MPLVSVIVPFLNEARFIRESIDSVLAQSHEDLELLLVDDGSSDDSTAIAQDYAERLPHRVRYLEHPGHDNRGRSASRNLGVAEARGTYIAFLDADDVWLPQKLSDQVSLLDEHPRAGFVCAPAEWWWSWAGLGTRADELQDLGVPVDGLVEPPALLRSYLRNEWASLCDVIVRRTVLDRIGGWEDCFRGMFDDQVVPRQAVPGVAGIRVGRLRVSVSPASRLVHRSSPCPRSAPRDATRLSGVARRLPRAACATALPCPPGRAIRASAPAPSRGSPRHRRRPRGGASHPSRRGRRSADGR